MDRWVLGSCRRLVLTGFCERSSLICGLFFVSGQSKANGRSLIIRHAGNNSPTILTGTHEMPGKMFMLAVVVSLMAHYLVLVLGRP